MTKKANKKTEWDVYWAKKVIDWELDLVKFGEKNTLEKKSAYTYQHAKCDYSGKNVSKQVHYENEQGKTICSKCRRIQL